MMKAFLLAVLLSSTQAAYAAKPLIEVWKSPSCGCCKDWVAHLEKSGFDVKLNETSDTASVREKLGMPNQYGSCHTAKVNGYVLEGHVPAKEVKRLIREKPKSLGLAVPAMPIGSPGMDGPMYQGRKDPYDVLLVDKNGNAQVYQSYGKAR